MVAATAVPLSPKSHDAFMQYYKTIQDLQNVSRLDMRSRLEELDRLYMREKNLSEENLRAKAANAAGDPNRYQDVTIPVVAPQVEAATVYQTSVFLTGEPLFGVVAEPAFIDAALQLETVIEDDSTRGGWARELMMFFRDGNKYNFAPLEVAWAQEVTYAIETNLAEDIKTGTPKEVIWQGNRVKRLDPYNTIVDRRVKPTEVHRKGEFAGYTELMTRIELKSFIAELPDKIVANITPAFETGVGSMGTGTAASSMGYYIPDINPVVSADEYSAGGTNWMSWAGLSEMRNKNIDYKDMYEVTTMYAKVLPSEFSLSVPNKNTPQIYKLIVINHQIIIYAELQTNAHGYLPILVGQPKEDGLGYQTKSLAEDAAPFQSLASTYMASIIASKRRAISDRTLYDPSRITSAAINSDNPSAKIPVRPKAYGSKISDSVYQFPYRDDQSGQSMQQIQALLGMANSLAGQNQASQGQFVKGNKTLHEFESVMNNSNGRDQMASILIEHQVFVPMKEILKINILQFQGGTTLYNKDKQRSVEIDPVELRKAVLSFKISDGLIPADKLINSESFRIGLEAISSNPALAGGYNLQGMFSYFMKTQGAQISEFEKSPEQVAYEQALNSWQGLAQMLIEKGGNVKELPPQPLPEQYGYVPANQGPAPESEQQEQQAQQSQEQGVLN